MKRYATPQNKNKNNNFNFNNKNNELEHVLLIHVDVKHTNVMLILFDFIALCHVTYK